MSWSDRLEVASFRGVTFDVMSIDDTRSKSLAKYLPPYSNGGKVEDMGADLPSYKLQAIISGSSYEIELIALLVALDMIGMGELVHPIYGRMQATCERYQVKHSPDLVDGCYVDLEFVVERSTTDSKPLFIPNIQPNEQLYIKVMRQPLVRLEQLQAQVEYFDQPLTLADIADKVRTGIRKATKVVNGVTKTINDFLSPPSWVNGIMSDVSALTRSVMTPNFSAIAEWRSVSKRFALLDDIFSSDDNPEPLRHVGRTLHVAALITATQVLIRAQTRNPTMTHADLISVRNEVRNVIQRAINAERSAVGDAGEQAASTLGSVPPIPLDTTTQVGTLKQVADTITQQLDALINTRPPIRSIVVRQPSNLRLLAHRLYGDHTRAPELLRLNPELINPALIDIGTDVQAYVQ